VHEADVRVHYAALQVSLIKAGMVDASEALWDWAEEWLDDVERETFEEELDLEQP